MIYLNLKWKVQGFSRSREKYVVRYEQDPNFEVLTCSHSGISSFIPIFAGYTGRQITNTKNGKSALIYNIPSKRVNMTLGVNDNYIGHFANLKYAELLDALDWGGEFHGLQNWIKSFRTARPSLIYSAMKGILMGDTKTSIAQRIKDTSDLLCS